MASVPEQLLTQALGLSHEQREELADHLLASLHPDGDATDPESLKNAWIRELNRRAAETDSGASARLPVESVWSEIAGHHAQ
jgi:putative addiction module component (TIGR02574 family)